MSRSYEMAIEISGIKKERRKNIQKAVQREWNIEVFDFGNRDAFASGEGNLSGGESEEGFAERVARTIWQANGAYCQVAVKATYLEELPFETYSFDQKTYQRFRRTGRG